MNDYNFGNRLCALRRQAGLTQREAADRLGVTSEAVSKWETGKSKRYKHSEKSPMSDTPPAAFEPAAMAEKAGTKEWLYGGAAQTASESTAICRRSCRKESMTRIRRFENQK